MLIWVKILITVVSVVAYVYKDSKMRKEAKNE